MTSASLLQLAQQGDPNTIALLISRSLSIDGLTVKADWQGSTLTVRLIGASLPDRTPLMAHLCPYVQSLTINGLVELRVFAYAPHTPTPLWDERVDWNQWAHPAPPTLRLSPLTLIPTNTEIAADRFVVCGLGSLGQYCVFNLKRFALREANIRIVAIDRSPPGEWEVSDLPALLAEPQIVGDCRDDAILLQAGIQQSRTILIVTSNESVNVETAIAARRLNPTIRILVRSSRQNLNQLLKQQLGNFDAFDPTDLPAPAFALAGLQQGILGFFTIDSYRFQVIEEPVKPKDFRFDGLSATSLSQKRTHRLLSYRSAHAAASPRAFYQWQTDTAVKAGDIITYVELVESNPSSASTLLNQEQSPWQQWQQSVQTIWQRGLIDNMGELRRWVQAARIRQVVSLGLGVALLLWLLGTLLFVFGARLSLPKAISLAFILLLGGYGDVFGGLETDTIEGQPIAGWVQILCGVISIASLASVLGVLGLLTDSLLSSRFEFLKKRRSIPNQQHVVVVGYGRMGQRVAALLREFRQPVVALTEQLDLLPDAVVPVIKGDLIAELPRTNPATAKSIIVVTDDQMLNLEVALMAQQAAHQHQRSIGLVIRTYDQRFRDNLNNLLPDAKALSASEIAAEAFAGAAFGERILGLFRLNDRTILVTEYQVTDRDTLVGKLLAQVAHGYGVVPILHQRANQFSTSDILDCLFPVEDGRLQVGDRLVVLSSINGLRRIEHGELAAARRWRLEAEKPLNTSFLHYCGNDLARISGCSLETARQFMDALPAAIELPLYDHQAHRLLQELGRQLPVRLVPLP